KLVAERRDRADVECVARVAVGARDPALAEDDVLLAAGHHALDPEKVGLGVERVATLVDHGEPRVAQAAPEGLGHPVRLAALQALDAGILVALDVGLIEDLDDGRELELAPRAHDELESPAQGLAVGGAEALPAAVGTRAILDHAAAKRLAARLLHHASGIHDLALALDRARTRDEHQLVRTARQLARPDGLETGLLRRALLRRPLVGARDGDELLDTGQFGDLALGQLRDVAVDPDQRDLLALELPGLEAEVVKLALDGPDLVRRGVTPHLHEHGGQCIPHPAGAVKRAGLRRGATCPMSRRWPEAPMGSSSPSTSAPPGCGPSCSMSPGASSARPTGRRCPPVPRPGWWSTISTRSSPPSGTSSAPWPPACGPPT